MKTSAKLSLAAALLAFAVMPAAAQDFPSAYFLGGYQYGYRMNPAFQSEHSFVSIGLGQFGANTESDLGISNFLFKSPSTGQMVTFLNDEVSASDFLDKLNKDGNRLNLNTNLNLLSLGIWGGSQLTYKTLDVSIRSSESLNLPYDMFRLIKEGTAGGSSTFNLDNTRLTARNFLEIAFGLSHNFNNRVSIGMRIKGLVGLANMDINVETMRLTTAASAWTVTSRGSLGVAIPGVEIGVDEQGYYDYGKIGLNAGQLTKNLGLGGALDIGASFNILPWITVSASLLDFGYVNWANNIVGQTDGSSFGIVMSDNQDEIFKNLEKIYKFKAVPSSAKTLGGAWEALPFRANVGAEVRLPFYQRISVGALYTYNKGNTFNANNILLSLNWSPLNFLSISGTTKISDKFKSFGGVINIHPGVVNLFVGMDAIPTKWYNIGSLAGENASKFVKSIMIVPADKLNLNCYFGLSIAFGKRKLDYRKMNRELLSKAAETKAAAKAKAEAEVKPLEEGEDAIIIVNEE